MPDNVGAMRIEYLHPAAIKKLSRKGKVRVRITVVDALRNERKSLIVSFRDFWTESSRRRYAYALEGGAGVLLRFDCAERLYAVEDLKVWAIRWAGVSSQLDPHSGRQTSLWS